MPRWNPIPSAICHEQSTDTDNQPSDNPKTNGYIFRRQIGETNGVTCYAPKICRAMPLYPKTYGLSCDRQDCPHCHPETAANFPDPYHRYQKSRIPWRHYYYYGFPYHPPPGSCLVGRKGCRPEKMIRIRTKTNDGAAKDETRRRAVRTEQAIEEEQDDSRRDKTQRLSKWETSTSRSIEEGCELASSEDVVLPTDDWKAVDWDLQLAILASQGLLDDYEAEDADISLNSLRWGEDTYTVRYKSDQKKASTYKGLSRGTPVMDDDMDWELVLGSPSEDSMSWIMLDE